MIGQPHKVRDVVWDSCSWLTVDRMGDLGRSFVSDALGDRQRIPEIVGRELVPPNEVRHLGDRERQRLSALIAKGTLGAWVPQSDDELAVARVYDKLIAVFDRDVSRRGSHANNTSLPCSGEAAALAVAKGLGVGAVVVSDDKSTKFVGSRDGNAPQAIRTEHMVAAVIAGLVKASESGGRKPGAAGALRTDVLSFGWTITERLNAVKTANAAKDGRSPELATVTTHDYEMAVLNPAYVVQPSKRMLQHLRSGFRTFAQDGFDTLDPQATLGQQLPEVG